MSESKRTTARTVRLADLDPLSAPGGRPARAEPPTEHLPRADARVAPDARRQPHLIGSTIPGPLADGPAEALLRAASKRKKRRHAKGPARDVPRLPRGVVQQWPVTMDATGPGYARIWLGNALLLLVTLGLAWPWTHRRTQRYFLRHTQVAGQRLDYDLPNWLLMPRLGMTAVLWLGLLGAAVGSFWVGMVALTLGALIWPTLAYLQLNHHVGAVTWAGRSLWFDGRWSGLYRVSALPVALALGVMWSVALASRLGVEHAWWSAGGLMLAWLFWLPLALWAYYQYRQQHIRLGPLRLIWQGQRADVLAAFTRTFWWGGMWTCLALGVAAVAVAVCMALGLSVTDQEALGVLAVALGMALTMWWPSLRASLMGAVWSRTGNRHLRFRSRLSMTSYARLYARLTWRLVLTLGLYWPWAVVAARRMRWQSVTISSRVDAEVLMSYWKAEAEPDSVHPPAWARAARAASEQTTQPSVASRYGTLD